MRRKERLIIFSVAALLVAGCATAPPPSPPFPYQTIRFHGDPYFAVVTMCEKEGVAWDYDPLSQVVLLKKKGFKEVKLLIAEKRIMVDNAFQNLSSPVQIKDSVIYAPLGLWDYFQPPICKFPEKGAAASALYLRPIDSATIDAGHGGKDTGAIGRFGLREKNVVLDVARRVKKELNLCGLSVYLTRESDEFIPLPERSQIANQRGADIFVSIHANANHSRWIEGVEVYYLTEALDDDARALAAAENAPTGLDDNFFRNQAFSLKAMLWDMIYTENRKESIELARFISAAVSRKMGLKELGVKGAPFAVLKGARMPAVLVEIGYISNREGEKKLRDPWYRQKMAEAIALGIMNFKNYSEGKR